MRDSRQEANVAEANQGATPNSAVALDQQPGAAAPQPQGQSVASGNVDLTSIPAFRKYQSEQDRRMAAMQEELDRLRNQNVQAEEQRIAAADPDERAAYYQQQVAAMRAEQERQQIGARIAQTIQRAGLDFNDPRLLPVISGAQPTAQMLADVNGVIAQIALEDKRRAEEATAAALAFQQQQAAAAQQVAVQRGQQAALVNAGVLTSSTSPSVVVPADPNAEKVAAYRTRYAQYKGKGLAVDNPGLRTLISDLRKDGMTLADLA